MELYYPLTRRMWILTETAAAGFISVKPVHSWPTLPAEVALAILLGFHCYLPISDFVNLTVELAVLPTDSTWSGICIASAE